MNDRHTDRLLSDIAASPDPRGPERLVAGYVDRTPYADLTDDQRAANVLKAFEPLGRLGETSRVWLTWSDPAFVRERFSKLAPGCFCLAKPTVAVMREAADGVEAGRLRVTIDGGYLRIYRHAESKPGLDGDHDTRASERGRVAPARVNNAGPTHTDPGDGLGLPLVCTDPAGLAGCRFCSPLSGAKGECESHRRAHAEMEVELRAEAARDDAEYKAELGGGA